MAYAARAGAPVPPDPLDAKVGALADGGLGRLRPGSDHHPIDPAGDGFQVVIAGVAFDLVRVWVHRENLVAALPQALVHDVAAVTCGFLDAPVTATRLPARNSAAACFIVCISGLLRLGPGASGLLRAGPGCWSGLARTSAAFGALRQLLAPHESS